jgi:hypothetical protein
MCSVLDRAVDVRVGYGLSSGRIVGLLLEERQQLEVIVASSSNPYRMVREARGLLMAADGVVNAVIAERLDVSRSTVLGWRRQFVDDGVAGVGRVRPGRGPSRRSRLR